MGTNVLTKQLSIPPFEDRMRQDGVRLIRERIDTVQINLGKLCNQSCTHCHVAAGPHRTEVMTPAMAELALDFVRATGAQVVDLTGGAPELNPSFRWLVDQLTRDGRHVIDRCNLTVLFEPGQEDVPDFLAERRVEIAASMPCYTKENVDEQRGRGVYDKSIAALRQLNLRGYGREGSGCILNLVHNPPGACLPAAQRELEGDYKRELKERHGIYFDRLLTITNMRLGRFASRLKRSGEYDTYWASLVGAFNPATLDHVMCLNMVSVSWDGFIYDCDFNMMLRLPLGKGKPFRLGELPAEEIARQLVHREILIGSQCYGCTAGSGSSCQGALR